MKFVRHLCRAALAAVAISSVVLPAAAQDRTGTVEITPFAGGHFGGRLYAGASSIFSDDVEVKNAATFGLRAAYNANPWLGIEAGFSTVRSDVETVHESEQIGTGVTIGTLDEQHSELNAVFNLGRRRVVPYLTLGAGVTRSSLKAEGAQGDVQTRFTANFGAGVKVSITPHIGLRAEWRVRAAHADAKQCDPASPYCDPSSSRYDDRWYYRWYTSNEVTGGATFTF